MNQTTKKAILAVSFGTSYETARKATIEKIEKEIAEAFPDYRVYRAWTSKMILAILKKRDNLYIPNVVEAMEQMKADGITDVVVQPTHILDGIENNVMKEEALSFQDSFHSITFGTPLISSQEDAHAVIGAVAEEFKEHLDDTALVLMGHGTTHQVNSIYAQIDTMFKEQGHSNIFLGTVEAEPTIHDLVREVCSYSPKKVVLAPFMIVAGDHAHNDMAGDEPDSWAYQFRQQNYEVQPVLKGLGEYPGIRSLFIDHVKQAISSQA